jgi:hypothetical protein
LLMSTRSPDPRSSRRDGWRLRGALACALLLGWLSCAHAQPAENPASGGPATWPAPSQPILPTTESAGTGSPAPAPIARPASDTPPEASEVDPVAAAMTALREEIRALEAGTTELEIANQRLTELNAQLRQEVESLAFELQAARAGNGQRVLLYGAGLILLGLLIGVLIKARPRRSAWS